LIGVDRRGGKGYQKVPCEICGGSLYISEDSESGICARCVVIGYPKPRTEINILDLKKAMEQNSLRQYRREKRISQTQMARMLEIAERHYRRLENGQPISRMIRRKIERKLAQVEQSP
jgi:DNA-binding XRE family transcriptional regulator